MIPAIQFPALSAVVLPDSEGELLGAECAVLGVVLVLVPGLVLELVLGLVFVLVLVLVFVLVVEALVDPSYPQIDKVLLNCSTVPLAV